MIVKKYYTLSVPCKTVFKNREEQPIFNGPLFLDKDSIIRFGPDGIVLIGGLFSSYYADKSLQDIFEKDEILPGELDTESINFLLKRGFLKKEKNGSPIRKYYSECTTAYYANFEVTMKCNAHCHWCYVKDNFDVTSAEPSLETLLKRLDILDKWGIQYLEIGGKEMLLREDARNILKAISDKKMKVCVLTNGSTVKDYLKDLKGKEVCISLDGRKGVHDSIRKFPGLHDLVIEALGLFKQEGITAYISSTIDRMNIGEIPYLIDIANRFDTPLIISKVIPPSRDIDLQYEKAILDITNLKKPGVKIFADALKRTKIEINNEAYYYGCDYGRRKITIKTNGAVIPCPYRREIEMGHIERLSVQEFNNQVEESRKQRLQQLQNCKSCLDKKCGGPCYFSKTYQERLINKIR